MEFRVKMDLVFLLLFFFFFFFLHFQVEARAPRPPPSYAPEMTSSTLTINSNIQLFPTLISDHSAPQVYWLDLD